MAEREKSPRLNSRSIFAIVGLLLAIAAVAVQFIFKFSVGGEWKDLPGKLVVLTYASIAALVCTFVARGGLARSSHPAAKPLFLVNLMGGIAGAIWLLLLAALLLRMATESG